MRYVVLDTDVASRAIKDQLGDRDVLAAVSRARRCVVGISSALLCGGAFLE
jgi:hypothetical protein